MQIKDNPVLTQSSMASFVEVGRNRLVIGPQNLPTAELVIATFHPELVETNVPTRRFEIIVENGMGTDWMINGHYSRGDNGV